MICDILKCISSNGGDIEQIKLLYTNTRCGYFSMQHRILLFEPRQHKFLRRLSPPQNTCSSAHCVSCKAPYLYNTNMVWQIVLLVKLHLCGHKLFTCTDCVNKHNTCHLRYIILMFWGEQENLSQMLKYLSQHFPPIEYHFIPFPETIFALSCLALAWKY